VYGWVANATSYDIDGRSVKAWQATYVDGSTSNPRPLSVMVVSAQSADGSQPATADQVTVNATASASPPKLVPPEIINFRSRKDRQFDEETIFGSYCQMSWMAAERQAASFSPSLKIAPAITAGSNVLPFSFRQWF